MTPAAPARSAWDDAALAAALFAIDPAGLGGVILRAAPGPARDAWMALTRALLPSAAPMLRIPAHIDDERLLGGLDLSASLAAGRPIAQRGVLAGCDGGVAVLPMAERLEDQTAARLASALDQGMVSVERDGLALRLPARLGLIALDEGLEAEERPPAPLFERLAFHIDLTGLGARAALSPGADPDAVAAARIRYAGIGPAADAILTALCRTAQAMGVDSARGALLALRAARAHAALRGGEAILDEDAAMAARLVLAPRAILAPAEAPQDAAPEAPEDPPADPAPPPDDLRNEPPDPDQEQANAAQAQTDQAIEAMEAALPEDLLARMKVESPGRARAPRARGEGAKVKAAKRGRPVGSRAGGWRSGDRLNLIETLRAATPWQKLRGGGLGEGGAGRVRVRREDFRVRRFVQKRESTTIFVVDASGSAAFQRLAEAKGAVELLLAKAYVSRTRVALVAFRGAGAEVLLPPTRSLTRAKRRLADLPGGGGTPLADGIDVALRLAIAERTQDRTPLLVLLTDGRANLGRGGTPGRPGAEADAMAAAGQVRAAGISAAYIDTAARPRPDGNRFARAMDAVYAPLPYLDAGAVFGLVDALTDGQPRERRA